MRKITIHDENFPQLLKKISNPPRQLYVEGDNQLSHITYPLAVVGTRKMSVYGRQIIEHFVRVLARTGITIISGLALGIDSLAHKVALENNTKTIAVLGSGLENIYPKVHYNLGKKIIQNSGALISEYPAETPPYQSNFIERNRIISGLSLGVLVIEAPEKSGALITAHNALIQKRKLFVIPGRVYDKNSQGANNLIRQGGQLVQTPEHILKELYIKPRAAQNNIKLDLSENEKIILAHINKSPIHIDAIGQNIKMSTHKIISLLSQMELKGIVKNIGNNQYVKN